MSDHLDLDPRAAEAFRSAVAGLPGDPADLAAVHRGVRDRRRRRGVAGTLAAALVLVIGTLTSTVWWPAGHVAEPASGPVPALFPTDPAPTGWRTEYYRNVSFEVPDAWDYSFAPGSDWCAGSDQPLDRTPYVSLGQRSTVLDIGCVGDLPTSQYVEHALISPITRGVDYIPYTEQRNGDWWTVSKVDGVVLSVVSQDRALARQIVNTLKEKPADPPCPGSSPILTSETARPPAFSLAAATDVGTMIICQYDGDSATATGGLRSVTRLDQRHARDAVRQILAAPVKKPTDCAYPNPSELRLLIRVEADHTIREVYLRAAGCPDGRAPGLGGFDDGTSVRTLTADACHAVLIKPATLEAASGDVGQNCVG